MSGSSGRGRRIDAPATLAWQIHEAEAPVRVELRRLAHARRLRLSFRPERGFLLTCPSSTPRAAIALALERAVPWALRLQAHQAPPTTPELPGLLHLPARHETWCVDYAATRNRIGEGRLAIAARADPDRALCGLRTLLKRLAVLTFQPRAMQLARDHGLSFTGLSCGLQRTRWGSCSSRGLIRLNSVLLFVEPELAEHVLLHELAHTRHLDHSPAFWRLLGTLDPDHEAHQRALRDAWKTLPTWWWQGGSLPGQAA